MIKSHQAFLFGEDGNHSFQFEVNWNPDDKKTNECKVIKATFPSKDGDKVTYLQRKHLHSFLFAISDEEEQAHIVPYKQETITYLKTTLGITANKDIKKGEMINVPVEIPIPLGVQEKIGRVRSLVEKNKSSAGILTPK